MIFMYMQGSGGGGGTPASNATSAPGAGGGAPASPPGAGGGAAPKSGGGGTPCSLRYLLILLYLSISLKIFFSTDIFINRLIIALYL
jgi:hypothetical protein